MKQRFERQLQEAQGKQDNSIPDESSLWIATGRNKGKSWAFEKGERFVTWQAQMESLLEKEFRRLLVILDDLGCIGAELEKNSETVKNIVKLQVSEDVKGQQLIDHLNFIRIPGYCAYQLTQEAVILLYLTSVKIYSLRPIYEENGDSVKIAKLNQYEAAVNQADPEIRRTIETLEPFSTLDSRKIVESVISSYKKT